LIRPRRPRRRTTGRAYDWQHAATITPEIDRVLPGALSAQIRLRSS
jgi:hypothetical protein